MRDITIVLPTKDEEECIGSVLEQIDELALPLDVIVVDDSESNETHTAVIRAVKNLSFIKVFFIKGLGNESPSIRWAFEHCKTEYAIVVDADGSQDINIIPGMIKCLEEGHDLVVGSRYVKGGSSGTTNRFSNIGNVFGRRLLGLKTLDLTGRYFAASTKLLLKSSEWDGRGENSIDVICYCEKRGYSVVELPFGYKKRIGGESKTNISKYLKTYFKKVWRLKFKDWKFFTKGYIGRAFKEDWTGEGADKPLSPAKQKLVNFIDSAQMMPNIALLIFFKVPVLRSLAEYFVRGWGRSVIGFYIRASYFKTKLAFMGQDVFIDSGVLFFGPERIYIDDGAFLDKDTSFECAEGMIRIGKCVHIGAGSYINGKPFVKIGDYTCIDTGGKVFGSSNKHVNPSGVRCSMSCAAPYWMQHIEKIGASLGEYSFLGPNTTLVCASIGDYCVVGSNSYVNKNLPNDCVASGSPARKIAENPDIQCQTCPEKKAFPSSLREKTYTPGKKK